MRRRNKLNAEKAEVDGLRFDSLKEANYYMQLRLMERAGEIKELRVHPKYDLMVNGEKVCGFWPDFEYLDDKGQRHVVDVKGYKGGATFAIFRLKAKLFHALYGTEVEVV